MARHSFSNVIGFDDSPFPSSHRGNVGIVGTVYAGRRFDGLLMGHVRRDGTNSAQKICELVRGSKFAEHARLVMLQGISLGGFNVVDICQVNRTLGMPVIVVARKYPDFDAIKDALLNKVSGGLKKWRLIEKIGPMEPVGNVFVQRSGLSIKEAEQVVKNFSIHGNIPEPLRTAHIIAGGLALGESRGRV